MNDSKETISTQPLLSMEPCSTLMEISIQAPSKMIFARELAPIIITIHKNTMKESGKMTCGKAGEHIAFFQVKSKLMGTGTMVYSMDMLK